jgi:glycerol-3-phosphate cytidylyltransferase
MIIGFTASAFDLLHAGHCAMLREAKSRCNYLICGLHIDPSVDKESKNQPVQTMVERYTQLNSIKYVDEIIPYRTEQDLVDILSTYDIDVRIIGEEYRDVEFTGKDICAHRNIEIHFNKRDHRFSTSELRSRINE